MRWIHFSIFQPPLHLDTQVKHTVLLLKQPPLTILYKSLASPSISPLQCKKLNALQFAKTISLISAATSPSPGCSSLLFSSINKYLLHTSFISLLFDDHTIAHVVTATAHHRLESTRRYPGEWRLSQHRRRSLRGHRPIIIFSCNLVESATSTMSKSSSHLAIHRSFTHCL